MRDERRLGLTAVTLGRVRGILVGCVALSPLSPLSPGVTFGTFKTSLEATGATRTSGPREAKVCGSGAFRRLGRFFRGRARRTDASPERAEPEPPEHQPPHPKLRFPLAPQLPATPFDFLDDANQLDPYKVLQLPFLSAPEKIRKAYIARCKIHHPDLHGGRESMEWLLTQRAHRILTDSGERVSYDFARVTRNAFSATEGVVKFGFVAAQEMGSVLSDAAEALNAVAARFLSAAQLLTDKSEAAPGRRGVPDIESSEVEIVPDTSRQTRIEALKQARKDLEAEANASKPETDDKDEKPKNKDL